MSEPQFPAEGDRPSSLNAAEVAVIAAGVVIGLTGLWSLVLAQLGTWSVAAVATGTVVAVFTTGWRIHSVRPTVSAARPALITLIVVLAIGHLAIVLPGHRVSFAGTDPGVYVQIARVIAETGEIDLPDPIVQLGLEDTAADSRYPALAPSSVRPARLDFSFYHLYPALSAPAYALGRTLGVSLVSPAIGMVGALALVLVIHRLRGIAAAAVGGSFFALSYIWIFYSDWNGSEIPTATFVLLALLAGLVAWDHDQLDAATASGLLAGVGANARADGLLVILAAVGLAGTAISLGRTRLGVAGLAGLAPPALVWGAQSYNTTVDYAEGHFVPDWPVVVGLSTSLVAAAFVVHQFGPLPIPSHRWRSFQAVGAGLYLLLLVGFWVRSQLSEPGSTAFVDYPSWYPFAAERITWFLGPAALVLVLLGFVELGRSRTYRPLAVLAPGLAVLPLYLWEQRVTAHMIWAMRRFVPLIWPTLGVLVGLGTALVVTGLAGRRRTAAVVVLAIVAVVPQLRWTVPLHDLREWSGGFALPAEVLQGREDGIFAWIDGPSHNALVVPLLIERGGGVVSLDADVTASELATIDRRVAPRQLYVLADSERRLLDLGVGDLTGFVVETRRLEYTWEEVPTAVENITFAFFVGRMP